MFQEFSVNQPRGQFSLLSMTSVCVSVCLSVLLGKTNFQVSWRHLVEGHITNISCGDFCVKKYKNGFLVLVNKPTVHNGGVSRGGVCGRGCWLSDRCLVTSDRWHVTHDIFCFMQDFLGR